MFRVDKKLLQSIYGNLLKLVSKFTEIIIKVEDNGIWLIVNVESFIKVFVPANVEKTGIFKVSKEPFESLFRLRSSELECSFNKEQNILNVQGGTKIELYVTFKVQKEDLEEPVIQSENVLKLKSRSIGEFKSNLNVVKFNSPDVNNSEFTLIKNTKDYLSLTFATTNLFARYSFKETLSKEDFELAIPIDKLKLALSLIESEVHISLDDRMIKIESDNLTLTIPALIDAQFTGLIEACDSLMSRTSLIDGQLDVSIKDFQNILGSVRSIATGNGTIYFNVNKKKMELKLENNTGTSKDKFKLDDNSIQEPFKFTIPELFIDAALTMGVAVNEKSVMKFGEDFKYFVFRQKNENVRLIIIGPVGIGDE